MSETYKVSNTVQKDLQASEIRYRRLFESARDGILIVDALNRKITDVNPFMIELLGYSRSAFLGKELWEIGLLKDEEASKKCFRELQEKGYVRYDDLPLKTKNGERRDVEVVSNAYQENGHQVIQCNIRDITERRRVEAALEEAEEKYRSIFEHAVEGIFQSAPDGQFIIVNPAMALLLGYQSPEEVITNRIGWERQYYVDPRRPLQVKQLLEEHGVVKGFESQVYRKDGTRIWISENLRVVRDSKGAILQYEGTVEDLTERQESAEALRKSEEQLRQSQKLESVGRLAGGIAHDFNNILTAINGYSDLLLRNLANDPLRRHIEEIKKAGERAASLTHQLLAFSRRQMLQPVVLDVNKAISDTLKMLQRLISENIQLVTALSPKAGSVKVDPGQLAQVLINLVVNASDAMPHGGNIIIETLDISVDANWGQRYQGLTPGNYVRLSVSDTGTGMNAETQQHIFEPFFTTKTVGKGTGLGLATVYGIVKQSGGNISLDSAVGHGTTFRIYLPRVAEKAGAATVPDTSYELPKGTETILLVEDEDAVRKLTCEVLESCDYTVIEARNGVEALSICEQEDCNIDLLITDLVMPQMSGPELVERLAELKPDLKVLYVSGYTDDNIVRRGLWDKRLHFLQKPFSLVAFTQKVRQVLDSEA